MSANGQNLECARVGKQEMWTVMQQTPSNPTSEQLWISTTPMSSAVPTQEPESTAPSQGTTETSETETSTASGTSTAPTTSESSSTPKEPTDSDSENDEVQSEEN